MTYEHFFSLAIETEIGVNIKTLPNNFVDKLVFKYCDTTIEVIRPRWFKKISGKILLLGWDAINEAEKLDGDFTNAFNKFYNVQ